MHLRVACCGVVLLMAAVTRAQPVLFAPGVISTPDNERNAAFTPDGDTVYFSKRAPGGPYYSAICVSARVRGTWSTPRIAPFSGRYVDMDPTIAPDGQTLVFASARGGASHLWIVRRTSGGEWSEPEALPSPIASDAAEGTPSFGPDGSLYFSSNRPGGAGSFDLYVAARDGDRWSAPVALTAVNTGAAELGPAVSKDGTLLVFMSAGRPDEIIGAGRTYFRGDLYASRKIGEGWGPPVHLPAPINSAAGECCASFSPDGETMYFTSERGFATDTPENALTWTAIEGGLTSILNGLGNIYAIPTRDVRRAVAP